MPSLAQRAQTIADLYQPPHTGRPSDIGSQSTLQQFLEAVGEGNYIETAAKLAGITKQSVYEWIKRGEAGERPFDTFADAVKEAEARAEAKMLANVRKASELPQFWAAGMTVLERRHPERWGKRQDDSSQPKVVVNIGVGSGDVRVGIVAGNNAGLSPENINELACGNHSQVEMLSPINRNYVNEPESAIACVPALGRGPDTTPIGTSLRPDRVGDPTPVGGGVGVPPRGARQKGRSFLGRARRKKGLAGG